MKHYFGSEQNYKALDACSALTAGLLPARHISSSMITNDGSNMITDNNNKTIQQVIIPVTHRWHDVIVSWLCKSTRPGPGLMKTFYCLFCLHNPAEGQQFDINLLQHKHN